jgi:hypothetical protein
MKFYVLFSVLLFFILVLGCTSTQAPVQTAVTSSVSEYTTAISENQYNGFTTYLNETEKYSLKYPLNTNIKQDFSVSQVLFTLKEPPIATKENPYTVGNYFVIQVHKLSEYTTKTPEGIWNYKYSQEASKGNTVTDIIKQPITFRGNPGILASFTVSGLINGKTVKANFMEIVFIQNEKVYELVYTGNPDSYEKYLPTAKKMFNSFKTGV